MTRIERKSMRTWLLAAAAVLATGPALAINKCTQADGRVVYTDAPCEAGQRAETPRLQGNTIEAGPRLRDSPRPAPAPPAPAAVPTRTSCLSEQEVRNIQASGTSIRMDRYDREVNREQVRRAGACEPLMTEAEMRGMKADLQQQARASRPAAPAVTSSTQSDFPSEDRLQNCVYGNCGSSSGASYRVDPLTNRIERRDDGATCTRTATGQVSCR